MVRFAPFARIVTIAVVSAAAMLTPARASSTAYVAVQAFTFVPDFITIATGDSVEWTNKDNTTHTVTELSCLRAGGTGACEMDHDVAPGTTFTHPFDTPGVYKYKCVIHDLPGTVEVIPPDGVLPDLVIGDVTVSSPSPTVLRLTATIRNISADVGTPSSQVLFEYAYHGTYRTIGAPLANPVHAGSTEQVSVLWTITGKLGDFEIRVTADGLHQVAESDESNNAASRSVAVLVPAGTVPGIDLLEP